MNLIIEEYWSKLASDTESPFGSRVLPEYELHNRSVYGNGGGWKSREDWRRSIKARKRAILSADGKAYFRGATLYGIRSYTLVYLED